MLEASNPPTTTFRGLNVTVKLPTGVKSSKEPEELASRWDATLEVYDSDGSLTVAADRFGFLTKDDHYPAIASPLTNLQRFLLKQHGR
jgi:hypothetical protein